MPFEINLLARDKKGFKVSLKATGDDLVQTVADYKEAARFAEEEGWQTEMEAAALRTFAPPVQTSGGAPVPAAPFATPSLVCVEDGANVTGESFGGNTYTATQIAAGRAKKIDELNAAGRSFARGPRCKDCWRRGGYANQYKSLKGFSS